MTALLNTTLERISRGLLMGGMNYSPSFMIVECKGMAGQSLQEVLDLAIGGAAVVGGSQSASKADVLSVVRASLDYRGDDGVHPSRDYLASIEFNRDADLVMIQVGTLVDGADTIISFRIKEGYPFYPVFWDFAFLIEKNKDAVIFIGSSSD